MNIYRYTFIAACPNNGEQIAYRLEIESAKMIQVEHILTACKMFKKGYHEDIADELYRRFDGRQILEANHHGVDVETRRGFD